MMPIKLTDSQLHEIMQAAQMVPLDLRSAFLERLVEALRGRALGDGLVHRVAYEVAREICWDADRRAAVG